MGSLRINHLEFLQDSRFFIAVLDVLPFGSEDELQSRTRLRFHQLFNQSIALRVQMRKRKSFGVLLHTLHIGLHEAFVQML